MKDTWKRWLLKVRICMGSKQFTKADHSAIVWLSGMWELGEHSELGSWKWILSVMLDQGAKMLFSNNTLSPFRNCSVGSPPCFLCEIVAACPFWFIWYLKGSVPTCQRLPLQPWLPLHPPTFAHSSEAKPLRMLSSVNRIPNNSIFKSVVLDQAL